ncbi:hypothetical protein R1flu_014809 [Riccia fluitans]|uniref:Uncharacterized protein n=1 Tax=Riccia fluitans TaxID=41844 RepID=A0ABD1YH58_9MARC
MTKRRWEFKVTRHAAEERGEKEPGGDLGTGVRPTIRSKGITTIDNNNTNASGLFVCGCDARPAVATLP